MTDSRQIAPPVPITKNIVSNPAMSFYNDEGPVGHFDFNGGVLIFTGKANEAAQMFINFAMQTFTGRLKEEFQAGRKAALEEAAQLCFDNAEEIGTKNGRSLAPFPHECQGLHSGMTYSKAIKELI